MHKPFLRWAGGKTQLLSSIRELYPEKIDTYYEPFLGGGAVFFDLAPDQYLISDSNPELINAYKVVASRSSELLKKLSGMQNNKKFFYNQRALKYEDLDSVSAAARTIYLNKTCFNGLYRVNKKGEFNVPYGKHNNPDFIQIKKIDFASKLLKSRGIKCMDFKSIQNINFSKNDFIFFDPPYVPLDGYADFKRYTKEQFNENSQVELAEIFHILSKRKVKMLLTNSNTPLIDELYAGFERKVIESNRSINSLSSNRKGQDVIIYTNI